MSFEENVKATLPFIFTYRDKVVVHNTIAEVVIRGHLLATLEATKEDGSEGDVWIYGVQPGDLSAGGEHFGEAHADFRQSFTTVLYDIADNSLTKEDFRASVKSFFNQVNKPVAEAWLKAVEAGRAEGRAFALKRNVPIGSADTPTSLQISFEVKANELEAGLEIVAA